jgi:hypothetical protein
MWWGRLLFCAATLSSTRCSIESERATVVAGRPNRMEQQPLVTNFAHVATYQAHFQVIRHALCSTTDSSLPVLSLVCDGPHIQLVQTSHATIQCASLPFNDIGTTGATLVCTNTCTNDDECRNVFLAIGN